MAKGSSYHVQFRRRRSGKTNYHRRKRLLQSREHRLVIRRSNKHQRVSIIDAKVIGDITLVDATSQHLKKYGWKGTTGNVPSAYLTGYLAGKYALSMNIKKAILDIGVNTCRKDTRISAMLCGVVQAGLKVPCKQETFPDEDRYTGKLIADFAKKLKKKNTQAYDKQFSGYKKLSAKPESLPTYFKATKKAIDDEYAAGTMKNKLKNRNKKNRESKTKPKPKTKPKSKTTKKTTKTPAKKPKPTKSTSKMKVDVNGDIKVTLSGNTYTVSKSISMKDLKAKRIPNTVKDKVAEIRGWKTWKKLS